MALYTELTKMLDKIPQDNNSVNRDISPCNALVRSMSCITS